MKRAKAGKFDTLWNLLPFMVLSAQMYSDEESREGLKFLMSTVGSGDDVLSWVDYLALPTNGWEGDEDPPQVDPFEGETPVAYNVPEWLFPQAHASVVQVVKKVTARVLGKALTTVSKKVTKGQAKNLPDALKVISKNARATPAKFRKYFHSASAMRASAWLISTAGLRQLRTFLRGKSNARYPMPLFALATAYLGWESTCGLVHDYEQDLAENPPAEGEEPNSDVGTTTEELGCNAGAGNVTLFNKNVRGELAKKYVALLADATSTELNEDDGLDAGFKISGTGHGALFHIMQTASLQLQHRFAGTKPIKGMEVSRWVAIFRDQNRRPQINRTKDAPNLNCSNMKCVAKLRNVDIALGEFGGNQEATLALPEKWIELKSWAAQSIKKDEKRYRTATEARFGEVKGKERVFTRWDYTQTKNDKPSALHRQYSLDRAAATTTRAWLTKKDSENKARNLQQNVDEFVWLWQSFKQYDSRKKNQKDPDAVSPLLGNKEKKYSLRWLVHERPSGDDKKDSEIHSLNFSTEPNVNVTMQLTTLASLLKNLASAGFEEAADFVAEELSAGED